MRRLSLVHLIVVVTLATSSWAAQPVTVSPGRPDLAVGVAGRCPTFSWGLVPHASALRLEVWVVASEDARQATQALGVDVAGSATSWTPELGRCLVPGATYAWRVGVPGEGGEVEWSEPAWFFLAPESSVPAGSGGVQPGGQSASSGSARSGDHVSGSAGGADATAEGRRLPAHARAASFFSVGNGGAVSAGAVAATSFAGDGSALTNLTPENIAAGTAGIDITGTAANVSGIVAVAHGGTGADTADDARANLSAASLVHGHAAADISGLTEGGITFGGGGGGALTQDTSQFFWDDTSNRLGIGTGTPSVQLEITGMMRMPVTAATSGTPTAGVLYLGNDYFLHDYPPGSDNLFVGEGAGNFSMTGINNTGLGNLALSSDTVGAHNTAIGHLGLLSNTEGNDNTAVGSTSLYANTVGRSNTAVGYQTLHENTTANGNTAVGAGSLYSQSFDNGGASWEARNTAVGYHALYANQPTAADEGYRNTAVGAGSLESNTTGSNNVALGTEAGFNLTTGSHNIDIGNQGLADEGNTIRIGDTNQTRTFIAGIHGVTPAGEAQQVVIDAAGQLGSSGVTGYVSSVFGRTGAVTASSGDYASSQVTSATHGEIQSTNVQGAIEELEDEKAPSSHTHPVANITGLTPGGVVFGGAASTPVQDSSNLNWDDTNNYLGIGTASPGKRLHVVGTGADAAVRIESSAYASKLQLVETSTAVQPMLQLGADAAKNSGVIEANNAGTEGASVGLEFHTRNAGVSVNNALVLTGPGRVGLGTSTPNEQLELTGNLRLPVTSGSTAGVVLLGGTRFLHNYAKPGSWAGNTFIGEGAGNVTLGGSDPWLASRETGLGNGALAAVTTGQDNTGVGYHALMATTSGADNTALGNQTLAANVSGGLNTAVGHDTLFGNTTGSSNTGIGQAALHAVSATGQNTALGAMAGYNATGSGNLFLGYAAGPSTADASSNRLYVANAAGTPLIFGAFDTHRVGVYLTDPSVALDVNGQIRSRTWSGTGDATVCRDINGVLVPCNAGVVLPAGSSGQTLRHNGASWVASSVLTNDGTASVSVSGHLDLPATTSSASGVFNLGGTRFMHIYSGGEGHNTFVGQGAGNFSMGGSHIWEGAWNTAVGWSSLAGDTTGYSNTATGHSTLLRNSTGAYNTASGSAALVNNTAGSSNTAVGANSLGNNSSGSENIAVGGGAGYNLTTGDWNIDIGNQGVAGEGNTIRIGDSNQTRAFIAGIHGVTPAGEAQQVVIDANGQLGSTGVTGYVSSVFGRNGAVTASSGDYTASQIASTTHGEVQSTNVQGAIEELEDEKAPGSHTHPLANITGLTAGGIVFGGGAGTPVQDTTGLFWDDTNNHLGIGTSSPTKPIHQRGQGALFHTADVGSPRTGAFLSIDIDQFSSAEGALSVYDRRTQTTLTRTPTLHLENASVATDATNPLLEVVAAGSTRLLVRQDGRVGVGTTSPSLTLDVNGQIRSRSWSGTGDATVCRDVNGVLVPCSGTADGVTSFSTRTGAVVPTSGDYTAAQITSTTHGDIASTNVQAAINELEDEKAPSSHTHAGGDVTSAVAEATNADTLDGLHASSFVQGETVVVVDDEFDTGALGSVNWTSSTTGGGSVGFGEAGVVILDTGNVGAGSATVVGNQQFALSSGALVFRARVSSYNDGSVWGDFQPRGLVSGTDRDNAIEFISASPSSVSCRTVSGGTATATTVGIGHNVVDKWTVYQIVASASTVRFYVDGNLIATHSTNIPTAALNLFFKTDNLGSGGLPVRVNHASLERRF